MTVEFRPIAAAEFPEYYRCIAETFGGDVRDSEREADRLVFEPDRSLAGFDGERIVATFGIYSRSMAVPGTQLPIAGVTMVSVAPTHRRQGHLTTMMRRALTELHDQGREPVAVLWAAEAAIYGRFGYGLASSNARVKVSSNDVRVTSAPAAGRLSQPNLNAALPSIRAIYDQAWPRISGHLDRAGNWWENRLYDPEHRREGATAVRCVLYEADGEPRGYALYHLKEKWGESGPDGEVHIRELEALDAPAHAALWRFLLELDLMRSVTYGMGRVDEPMVHLVTNPRAVQATLADALWVRVVDVGRALAARRYRAPVDVVFEVGDEFCPWNAGRWRLVGGPEGATCAPTGDPAQLRLTATELGAAYLGGTTLATLAAAGRVVEEKDGVLADVSTAFGHDPAPWCPEIF